MLLIIISCPNFHFSWHLFHNTGWSILIKHVISLRLYWGNHTIDPYHQSHNASWIYPTMHHFVKDVCTHVPLYVIHDDIKWRHFPPYWPFVRGIRQSLVNSPHKGQWRGTLMGFFICAWANGWVSNRDIADLRRHRAHYDVIVIEWCIVWYGTSGLWDLPQCQ